MGGPVDRNCEDLVCEICACTGGLLVHCKNRWCRSARHQSCFDSPAVLQLTQAQIKKDLAFVCYTCGAFRAAAIKNGDPVSAHIGVLQGAAQPQRPAGDTGEPQGAVALDSDGDVPMAQHDMPRKVPHPPKQPYLQANACDDDSEAAAKAKRQALSKKEMKNAARIATAAAAAAAAAAAQVHDPSASTSAESDDSMADDTVRSADRATISHGTAGVSPTAAAPTLDYAGVSVWSTYALVCGSKDRQRLQKPRFMSLNKLMLKQKSAAAPYTFTIRAHPRAVEASLSEEEEEALDAPVASTLPAPTATPARHKPETAPPKPGGKLATQACDFSSDDDDDMDYVVPDDELPRHLQTSSKALSMFGSNPKASVKASASGAGGQGSKVPKQRGTAVSPPQGAGPMRKPQHRPDADLPDGNSKHASLTKAGSTDGGKGPSIEASGRKDMSGKLFDSKAGRKLGGDRPAGLANASVHKKPANLPAAADMVTRPAKIAKLGQGGVGSAFGGPSGGSCLANGRVTGASGTTSQPSTGRKAVLQELQPMEFDFDDDLVAINDVRVGVTGQTVKVRERAPGVVQVQRTAGELERERKKQAIRAEQAKQALQNQLPQPQRSKPVSALDGRPSTSAAAMGSVGRAGIGSAAGGIAPRAANTTTGMLPVNRAAAASAGRPLGAMAVGPKAAQVAQRSGPSVGGRGAASTGGVGDVNRAVAGPGGLHGGSVEPDGQNVPARKSGYDPFKSIDAPRTIHATAAPEAPVGGSGPASSPSAAQKLWKGMMELHWRMAGKEECKVVRMLAECCHPHLKLKAMLLKLTDAKLITSLVREDQLPPHIPQVAAAVCGSRDEDTSLVTFSTASCLEVDAKAFRAVGFPFLLKESNMYVRVEVPDTAISPFLKQAKQQAILAAERRRLEAAAGTTTRVFAGGNGQAVAGQPLRHNSNSGRMQEEAAANDAGTAAATGIGGNLGLVAGGAADLFEGEGPPRPAFESEFDGYLYLRPLEFKKGGHLACLNWSQKWVELCPAAYTAAMADPSIYITIPPVYSKFPDSGYRVSRPHYQRRRVQFASEEVESKHHSSTQFAVERKKERQQEKQERARVAGPAKPAFDDDGAEDAVDTAPAAAPSSGRAGAGVAGTRLGGAAASGWSGTVAPNLGAVAASSFAAGATGAGGLVRTASKERRDTPASPLLGSEAIILPTRLPSANLLGSATVRSTSQAHGLPPRYPASSTQLQVNPFLHANHSQPQPQLSRQLSGSSAYSLDRAASPSAEGFSPSDFLSDMPSPQHDLQQQQQQQQRPPSASGAGAAAVAAGAAASHASAPGAGTGTLGFLSGVPASSSSRILDRSNASGLSQRPPLHASLPSKVHRPQTARLASMVSRKGSPTPRTTPSPSISPAPSLLPSPIASGMPALGATEAAMTHLLAGKIILSSAVSGKTASMEPAPAVAAAAHRPAAPSAPFFLPTVEGPHMQALGSTAFAAPPPMGLSATHIATLGVTAGIAPGVVTEITPHSAAAAAVAATAACTVQQAPSAVQTSATVVDKSAGPATATNSAALREAAPVAQPDNADVDMDLDMDVDTHVPEKPEGPAPWMASPPLPLPLTLSQADQHELPPHMVRAQIPITIPPSDMLVPALSPPLPSQSPPPIPGGPPPPLVLPPLPAGPPPPLPSLEAPRSLQSKPSPRQSAELGLPLSEPLLHPFQAPVAEPQQQGLLVLAPLSSRAGSPPQPLPVSTLKVLNVEAAQINLASTAPAIRSVVQPPLPVYADTLPSPLRPPSSMAEGGAETCALEVVPSVLHTYAGQPTATQLVMQVPPAASHTSTQALAQAAASAGADLYQPLPSLSSQALGSAHPGVLRSPQASVTMPPGSFDQLSSLNQLLGPSYLTAREAPLLTDPAKLPSLPKRRSYKSRSSDGRATGTVAAPQQQHQQEQKQEQQVRVDLPLGPVKSESQQILIVGPQAGPSNALPQPPGQLSLGALSASEQPLHHAETQHQQASTLNKEAGQLATVTPLQSVPLPPLSLPLPQQPNDLLHQGPQQVPPQHVPPVHSPRQTTLPSNPALELLFMQLQQPFHPREQPNLRICPVLTQDDREKYGEAIAWCTLHLQWQQVEPDALQSGDIVLVNLSQWNASHFKLQRRLLNVREATQLVVRFFHPRPFLAYAGAPTAMLPAGPSHGIPETDVLDAPGHYFGMGMALYVDRHALLHGTEWLLPIITLLSAGKARFPSKLGAWVVRVQPAELAAAEQQGSGDVKRLLWQARNAGVLQEMDNEKDISAGDPSATRLPPQLHRDCAKSCVKRYDARFFVATYCPPEHLTGAHQEEARQMAVRMQSERSRLITLAPLETVLHFLQQLLPSTV